MNDFFDFNGDGRIDSGEHFIGYQIYKDSQTNFSTTNKTHKVGSGIKVWHVIGIILLFLYWISSMTNPYNRGFSYSTRSYKSNSYTSRSSSYNSSASGTRALTKEEADALRGTGFHGTRPHSSAENLELDAAQNKCKICGLHTDNGRNSKCDACRKKYGGS